MKPKEEYEKELLEGIKKKAEAIALLSPEDLVKQEAVDKALKILKDAQVPFWLFAEFVCPSGYTYYPGENWIYDPYDKDGNLTQGGQDFLKSHYSKLFFSIDLILNNLAIQKQIKPTPENRTFIFNELCRQEYENSLNFLPNDNI